MQSEDAAGSMEWDVAELKRSVVEWEQIAGQLLELLGTTLDSPAARNWRPHAAQIATVVRRFRELCQQEAERFGAWREDGLAPDEAYDRVWDAGDQLVHWLNRMMET